MADTAAVLAEAVRRVGAAEPGEAAQPPALWCLERDVAGVEGRREMAFRIDIEAELHMLAEQAGISYEAAQAEVEDLLASVHAKDRRPAGSTAPGRTRASRW